MQHPSLDGTDLTWLTGLARALVREPHAADDLVQDALVASLEHGAVRGETRHAWFAAVVRRLAIQRFRASSSRVARETATARSEAQDDSTELVERAEAAEQVVSAARSLAEPYRTTILLRFLEGRSVREIAEREGVTPDSVRRRIRDGLEQMRAELLRRDRRGWREWRAALVPLAAGPRGARSSAGPGTWALRAAGVALLGGAIAVPLSVAWKPVRPAAPSASAPAALGVGAVSGAPTPLAGTPEPASPERAALLVAGGADSSAVLGREEEVATAEPPASGIRGRLMAPDGTPAVGVGVRVDGWPSNQYSPQIHGGVEDWVDPEGVSDEQGRFEFRFDPPPAHGFTIQTEPGVFGRAAWRFSELDADSVMDLGTVELLPTGSLRLRPLDGAGAPFSDELEFFVDFEERTSGPGGIRPTVRQKYDPPDGALILEGLAAGKHSFRVWSHALFWVKGGGFTIDPGAVTELDWTLGGVQLERSIAVTPLLGPASPWQFFVERGARLVSEADGTPLEPGRLLRRDLEPGTYALEFEHPWFVVESNTGLETGRRHSVPVRGSAALDLRVLDGPGGEAVQDYSASLRYIERADRSVTLRTLGEGPQQGAFEGIVPTALQVEVDAGGLGTGFAETAQLAPGQTTTLVVELGRPTELTVQVRGASSGAPLAGREVVAVSRAHGEPPLWVEGRVGPPARATTDAAGVARLTLERAEPVWVATRVPPGEVVERLVSPIDGEFETVVIEAAETVPVSGVLHCATPLAGWALELIWEPQAPIHAELAQRRTPYDLVSRSWSQELGPSREFGPVKFGPVELGPGQYSARLSRPVPSLAGYEFVELGARSLEPGSSGVEWSFEVSLPVRGRVVGTFLVDGLPAAGARLRLLGPPAGSPPAIVLDGAGRIDAEVAPGVYGLYLGIGSVLGDGPVLTAWLPGTATVVEGETVELGADVATARRGLRLLEPDGAPLEGKRPIRIVPADSPADTGSWTSGGWPVEPHEMWLPLGRYRVEVDGEPRAEFDWVAGEEPLVVVLPD